MALHKEKERLCRELGDPAGLATILANQADLLSQEMDKLQEAPPVVEEAHRLAAQYGLTTLAQQIKPIMDAVRAKLE